MIVHFISGKSNIAHHIIELRRIIAAIHRDGHVLARDWVEPEYSAATQTTREAIDWPSIFQENMESLNRADVLIAEISESSFGVGYQVAVAAHQKKPILLLSPPGGSEESLALGVTYDYIERKEYTLETIDEIVGKFLQDHDIKIKDMRFNFFIDRTVYNYLRWSSYKTGKTKAEILRELVLREAERDGG